MTATDSCSMDLNVTMLGKWKETHKDTYYVTASVWSLREGKPAGGKGKGIMAVVGRRIGLGGGP